MVIRWAASTGSWLLAAGVLTSICSMPAAAEDQAPPIRVCADPDNLPYSNEASQGYENKIAELVAQDLGVPLEYYWWPHQRGLIKNTLKPNNCDVLIAIPKGYDPVLWTKPYFRSGYVLAARRDRKLGLRSLDDPALKGLRIGVHVDSPPYDVLANRGLTDNIVSYRLFFDFRNADPSVRPQHILEELASGAIDAAVAWGPLVGYFAKEHPEPALDVVPLVDDATEAMTFEFSMGVRKGDRELKARLEQVIDHKSAEFTRILEGYGVPLLPLKPPTPESAESKPPPPGSHRHDSGNE